MDWGLPPVKGGDELMKAVGAPESELTNKGKLIK